MRFSMCEWQHFYLVQKLHELFITPDGLIESLIFNLHVWVKYDMIALVVIFTRLWESAST